jgi:hypothetical protein
MSNQEQARRMYDILSTKAALGMGYGDEDMYDIEGEGYGTREGARKGWKTRRRNMRKAARTKTAKRKTAKPRKKNPWITFIKKYAAERGISYREALNSKRACLIYRREMGMSRADFPCDRDYPVPVRRSGSKTCPRGKRIESVKGYTRSSGRKVAPFKRCI